MTTGSLQRDEFALSVAFAAPETSLQAALCEICREAFNLNCLGIDDDFFELGGDSLVAATICASIAAKLGTKIQPGALARNRTVRRLVQKLNFKTPISTILQNIQQGQDKTPPLFILPGNSGFTVMRPAFLDGIGSNTPIYTFQIPGLTAPEIFPATIQDLAHRFVTAIIELKHVSAFHIVSFCGTALVLQHMLQELKDLQRTPLNAMMVDPSFSLALPHLYEKRRAAGRPLALSWSAYLRMKYHMVRKFGLVTPKVGPDGRFIRVKNTGRYLGSAEHHNNVRNRWGANLQSALAADTAYTLMLQENCPPQVDEAVQIITSKSLWQGRNRLDVDAVRIFLPQAQWHNLQVQSHLDLIANDQIHMACSLREIMQQSGTGTAINSAP